MDRALENGIRVAAWTCDELYGRDSRFLDGLTERNQAYVAEIPANTYVWIEKPKVIRKQRKTRGKVRRKKIPRTASRSRAYQVRNLIRHSSKFRRQSWQPYRIKDTQRGPQVWDIKWLKAWRKAGNKLPSTQQTLIVARNVRTGEMKYFISNRVVGRKGVTLRGLLRVAFGRWSIEASFRVAKEELGMDHFEVRGWRCIHRHYYVTGLSSLLCSRIRQTLDKNQDGTLTVEQVRRSLNAYLHYYHQPPDVRDAEFEKELTDQRYYQKRNAIAKHSHTKTRIAYFESLGIDIYTIKSCL